VGAPDLSTAKNKERVKTFREKKESENFDYITEGEKGKGKGETYLYGGDERDMIGPPEKQGPRLSPALAKGSFTNGEETLLKEGREFSIRSLRRKEKDPKRRKKVFEG